jgi:hypothetical protein
MRGGGFWFFHGQEMSYDLWAYPTLSYSIVKVSVATVPKCERWANLRATQVDLFRMFM